MKRAIKAWGCDSPDSRKKPHTCTISREFWFSDNGGCTLADINGRDKKRVERRLKACRALGPDEEISGTVEAVSFDNTLGEIERVVEEDMSKDRVIPVNSIEM